MSDPQFFGYGSLVNLRTHSYRSPQPSTLTGWSRVWQPSKDRQVAFLSVLPDPNGIIDGVIATVPDSDWTALDEREYNYCRADITDQIGGSAQTAIYQGNPSFIDDGARYPILLSYLDVVVQGFHDLFGDTGVRRFFDSTLRWDTPILNDRVTPLYPRHQTLSTAETALVDANLERLMAVIEKPM